MPRLTKRLTPDQARAKAEQCREAATRTEDQEQKAAFQTLAATWERIAQNLEQER